MPVSGTGIASGIVRKAHFYPTQSRKKMPGRTNCRGRVQCLCSKWYSLPVSFPDELQVVIAHEKDLAKYEVQSADRADAFRFFSHNRFQKAISLLLADVLLPFRRSALDPFPCCLVNPVTNLIIVPIVFRKEAAIWKCINPRRMASNYW